jgi:hypothetical protein
LLEGFMADPKGGKLAAVVDGTDVHPKNAISVAMEDLSKEDREEIEHELKAEMAERHSKKLACFPKTRYGVIKKADMATTSRTKVGTLLSPKDLVQLVDVSVAIKYGADLTQFTRVIVEEMCSTLDTFKQEMHNTLPRQVRTILQQLSGEARGKRMEGSPIAPGPSIVAGMVISRLWLASVRLTRGLV